MAVTGPISATVATLRESGGGPVQPHLWAAPRQRLATLHAEEPHAASDIVDALAKDLTKLTWVRASKHFLGGGLEQGLPSFEPALKVKRGLLRRAAEEKATATQDAAAGRARTGPMVSAAFRIAALEACNAGGNTVGCRFLPARPCPRCGAAAETARHRYFECPENSASELLEFEPAVGKTQWMGKHLGNAAGVAGADGLPADGIRAFEECLWGRGILPANRLENLRSDTEAASVELGSFCGAAHASATVYTDGSGGPNWALKALRRVGAGAASFELESGRGEDSQHWHFRSFGLLCCRVPGRQTVPRAETWAGAKALAAFGPSLLHWLCDASYTVQGAQHSDTRLSGRNGDVWVELMSQIRRIPDFAGPRKIRAHTTLECVRRGDVSFADYLGNNLADAAAGAAGQVFQESTPTLSSAERDFALAVLLNRRISAIEAMCWQAVAASFVPRPVMPSLPEVVEADATAAAALHDMRRSGHNLYKYNSGSACTQCQRWFSAARAWKWSKMPCLPATQGHGLDFAAVPSQAVPAGEPETQVEQECAV